MSPSLPLLRRNALMIILRPMSVLASVGVLFLLYYVHALQLGDHAGSTCIRQLLFPFPNELRLQSSQLLYTLVGCDGASYTAEAFSATVLPDGLRWLCIP